MTWGSWTWWPLPWSAELVQDVKLPMVKARPFSTTTTRPLEVEWPTKIRVWPSLARVAKPPGTPRPTKTRVW
jgi:hypothetical protein